MIASDDPEKFKWLSKTKQYGGSFVSNFATACFAADDANYEILTPVIEKMMEKYPQHTNWHD